MIKLDGWADAHESCRAKASPRPSREVGRRRNGGTCIGRAILLTMGPTPGVTPLVETRFDERGGVVSPEGRWLAYESNRSGTYEIYVQPFPNVDGGLWQVSTGGGVQPLWARSGRELFYIAPDDALMAVPVETRALSGRLARRRGCSKDGTLPAARGQPCASTMLRPTGSGS